MPLSKLPATALAAGAAKGNFGAGAVLQVVQASTSSQTSSTSNTYADATNLFASITPSSSTSKILVLVDYSAYVQTDNACQMGVRLMRNGSVVVWEDAFATMNNVNANVATGTRNCINKLDSPNTTGALTYKLQFKRSYIAGTGYAVYINGNTVNVSTITLMEIAG
jgi:hypothetical protein